MIASSRAQQCRAASMLQQLLQMWCDVYHCCHHQLDFLLVDVQQKNMQHVSW